MKNQCITISLPQSLVALVENLQEARRDPTRSDTVRLLLLQALAAMSYLPDCEKKALGINDGRRSRRTET
jgi:metal-responsive CopG/Arc/MetJ family transcriptional regulator